MNPSTPQKNKLLIVEDDFYIRDTYTIQARLMNFDIMTAVDGEEALDKIKTKTIDIMLLDLMLPKIDGMSILKMVKSDPLYSALKIIVISNMDDLSLKEEAKKLGALEYLLKIQYPPREVLEITQKYLQ